MENIIPSLLLIQQAKITVLCDIDLEKVRKACEWFGVENYYTDFNRMIENENLDAIVAVCYPQTHFTIAKRALERKIPVFVEKPPVVTTQELIQLCSMASSNNTITGVGMNFRYADPIKRIKEIIHNDIFGNIKHLSIKHYCNKPKEPMWGLKSLIRSFLLAQAIHPIDLIISFGDEVNEIKTCSFYNSEMLLLNVVFTFKSGFIGHLTTGTCAPHFVFDMEIISDQSKIINLESLWNLQVSNNAQKTRLLNETKRWYDVWRPSPLNSGYSRSGYYNELHTFINSLLDGQQYSPSFCDLLPTYNAIDAIEQEFKSATVM